MTAQSSQREKHTTIAIVFCGNCNPAIDARSVANQVRRLLPECEFQHAESNEAGALLVISGCAVDCATRPRRTMKTVVIAGESVGGAPCPKALLAETACGQLRLITS